MSERKITVLLTVDDKGAVKVIDNLGDSAGKAAKHVDKLDDSQGKASKSAIGLGDGLKIVTGAAAGFLIGGAIAKGPEIIGGLVSTFSTLELQAKKAETVFGDQLGTVKEWAAANASAMGLTKNEATNLAAGLADLLIPMGMSREEAAKMATTTVGLSGALSEWSGGQKSAAEVSEILTKAYLGETDGLKALGISISASDVSARLAAKGQDELTGAALEQARALAIQELVFEKSTDAQKAFADGADSAARKQAEMRAKTEEAKEALARSLGPVIQQVTTLLATAAVPAFTVLGVAIAALARGAQPAAAALGWVGGHLDALQPFLLPLAGLITGVAAVILGSMVPAAIAWTAVELAKTTAMIASAAAFIAANAPLIAIAAAVGLLIAGIILLVQNWDTITAKVPLLGVAFDAVKVVMEAFLGFITGPFTDGVGKVPTIVEEGFNKALSFVKDNFGFMWDPYIKAPLEAIKLGVESQLDTVKNLFETAFGVIRGIFEVFAGLFTGDWDRMKEGLLQIGTALKEGFVEQMRIMIELVSGLGGLAWAAMKKVGDQMLEGLKAAFQAVGGVMSDFSAALIGGLKGAWNAMVDWADSHFRLHISVPFAPDIDFDPDLSFAKLAKGGIVTRPTFALIGEAGPEAVIPLSKMRSGGVGGGISVHIHGDVYARDEAEARRSAGWLGYGLAASLRARGAA